jgi:hypothetical protein
VLFLVKFATLTVLIFKRNTIMPHQCPYFADFKFCIDEIDSEDCVKCKRSRINSTYCIDPDPQTCETVKQLGLSQCPISEDIDCRIPKSVGKKFDDDKLRWDLLPLKPIEDVVKVLTFGAKKYGPENWRKVEDGVDRYYAACMRHIVAHKMGEKNDPESNLSHLAHAICNLIFMQELDHE